MDPMDVDSPAPDATQGNKSSLPPPAAGLSSPVGPSASTAAVSSASSLPPASTSTSLKDLKPDLKQEDLARSDISLAELVGLMDEYQPLVPDAVTDYYLAKAGFDCSDVRVKRVLALAAQKFVADVASDALHFSKLRQQPPSTQQRKGPKKHALTIEDLTQALAEYGISIKKPEYYT